MGNIAYYDCVLIHTPKFNHYFHPLGKVGFINIIPTGLFSMADILARNGFKTKILHMGLMRLKNTGIANKEILRDYRARIYGLSLMWHYQICDVIEMAKTIKEVYPDSVVVLGGITASVFKKEILSKFHFVDFVVDGEGEIPFLRLTEEITKNPLKPDLSSVPNLFYGKEVIKEPAEIISTPQELFDELSFLRPDLLEDFNLYSRLHFYNKYDNRMLNGLLDIIKPCTSPLWYITLGRGCAYQCSFCAAKHNLTNVLHRRKPIIRKIDSVLADIENARRYSIKKLTSAFYYDKREDYFIRFLTEFSEQFRDIDLNFDCWGTPSRELIDVFSSLSKDSAINCVIYSLSEKLRDSNNIHRFSNTDLINSVRYARQKKVKTRIILTSGLPFEDREAIEENLKTIKTIRSIDPGCQIIFAYTEISPCSDMYTNPERYNITVSLGCFDDFLEKNKTGRFFFGYSPCSMSERELQKTKCENMCFLNIDYGKYLCATLNRITRCF